MTSRAEIATKDAKAYAKPLGRIMAQTIAPRATNSGYRASVAQWQAELAVRRPKVAKRVANPRLHTNVQDKLSGRITIPDGTVVARPPPPRFTGRWRPHRKDRAWTNAWSPEQIANRIKADFPDEESMRICHEAIYQSPYIKGRNPLKRELVWCLRGWRALRAPGSVPAARRGRTSRGRR